MLPSTAMTKRLSLLKLMPRVMGIYLNFNKSQFKLEYLQSLPDKDCKYLGFDKWLFTGYRQRVNMVFYKGQSSFSI